MNKITKVFFMLIRSAVYKEELSEREKNLYSTEDLMELRKIARAHDVSNILAIGLKNNNLVPPDSEKENEAEILKAIYRYEQLSFELEKLSAALEEAKIPFMPLKGSVLRRYYPEPWMRTSCDIDIYVKKEDFDCAIDMLKKNCQYKYAYDTPHDISLAAPSGRHIELHHDLFEDDEVGVPNGIIDKIWKFSSVCDGYSYRYQMSAELFYFYHIAHMAKHLEVSGCGIRPFVDMLVMEKNMPYDRQKLCAMLEEAGLLDFFKAVCELKDVWFFGSEQTNQTEYLEKFIIDGGVYGTQKNIAQMKAAGGTGKLKAFLKLMILPRENLEIVYPSLKKRPYLFPLYQVRRWCRFFVPSKRKKIMHLTSVRNSVTKEERDLTKKMFDDLKLDNYKKWD